ncbi:helix-turn-helix domain-containing protein [Oceanobacillus profundus]|uniref:helix-turn-helix domain-containing protein n=1 Tax=Oceanobacillus profundus TaxID=372463 RepID=UPI0026E1B884|nr:helix-turn-helix transcriptional regulator [Oceanobacillus profundus]MDO6450552.1 helix-turn-helix transcriptional regulator [Oceanobacillus profundus]
MTLGERLRISRMRKKLTQIQVAKKLNISNISLSSYERDTTDPDTRTLKKLSELYEVSTDYLLGLTDYENEGTYNKKKSKLDNVFDEVLLEVQSENEPTIYMDEANLDEETLRLIKKALKNGMKFVDEMKRDGK